MLKLLLIFLLTACSTGHQKPNQKQEPQKALKAKMFSAKQEQFRNKNNLHPGLKLFCNKVDGAFDKYNWSQSYCRNYDWHFFRRSSQGTPLVWYVLGNESLEGRSGVNVTLIMCGVHGDEITPVKFCFDLLRDFSNDQELMKNKLIVVAPIVSPDSFFKRRPTRTNANGVDVNRNFPTKDWNARALKRWKNRYGKDKRRFPGPKAMSEQETIFQMNLVKRYNPQKIISVHAPLTLLDYDGPKITTSHSSRDHGKQLLLDMSKKAGNYKVSNYPYFTGSLGNWAGNEQEIPTYTLELPKTDWNKTNIYWRQFKASIIHAINQDVSLNQEASL